ncbi:hypothetical protein D3C76_1394080 [compost metagenome]
MGHAAGQPVPADRFQRLSLGTLAGHGSARAGGALAGPGVRRADAVRIQSDLDPVGLPLCIETGCDPVVHEWRRRGVFHESIWRAY